MAISLRGVMTLSIAEVTLCITARVMSRNPISTAIARPIPAAIPPTQKARRFGIGLGRDIKTTAIPIRKGSVAAPSANKSTMTHMQGTLPWSSGSRSGTYENDGKFDR